MAFALPPEQFHRMCSGDFAESTAGFFMSKPQIEGIVENDGLKMKKIETMKYFKSPRIYPLDLNIGIDSYIGRSDDYFSSKAEVVTYYLMNRNEKSEQNNIYQREDEKAAKGGGTLHSMASSNSSSSITQDNRSSGKLSYNESYEVVTHHHVLNILMKTTNRNFVEPWVILATKYNNIVYLSKLRSRGFKPAARESTYHYKFTQYCFTGDPNDEPNILDPVNENKQIYGIFKTRLGNLNITYSAEIDGIATSEKLSNINDIDEFRQCPIVCTKLIRDDIRNWKHNYRMLDWWIKCYIVGAVDLYVGFRTRDGYVQDPLTHVKVNQLPRNQPWSPKVCTTFVHTFITKVIEKMRDINDLYSSYKFCFDPKTKNITYTIYEGLSEHSVLPDDFVEYLRRNS